MTEELEKEAEDYADNQIGCGDGYYEWTDVKEAYLASAEPREKQIEIDAKQIRALQKQNGELTDKVKELEAQLSKLKPYRCKNHYAVSEKETSNAVLCYRVQNCESCRHFKEAKE